MKFICDGLRSAHTRALLLTRPERAQVSMSSLLHLEGKQRKEYHFQTFKKFSLMRIQEQLVSPSEETVFEYNQVLFTRSVPSRQCPPFNR